LVTANSNSNLRIVATINLQRLESSSQCGEDHALNMILSKVRFQQRKDGSGFRTVAKPTSRYSRSFQFCQAEDGGIEQVFYPPDEEDDVIRFKKGVARAFHTQLGGNTKRMEEIKGVSIVHHFQQREGPEDVIKVEHTRENALQTNHLVDGYKKRSVFRSGVLEHVEIRDSIKRNPHGLTAMSRSIDTFFHGVNVNKGARSLEESTQQSDSVPEAEATTTMKLVFSKPISPHSKYARFSELKSDGRSTCQTRVFS
jgi:hypothetical protein